MRAGTPTTPSHKKLVKTEKRGVPPTPPPRLSEYAQLALLEQKIENQIRLVKGHTELLENLVADYTELVDNMASGGDG